MWYRYNHSLPIVCSCCHILSSVIATSWITAYLITAYLITASYIDFYCTTRTVSPSLYAIPQIYLSRLSLTLSLLSHSTDTERVVRIPRPRLNIRHHTTGSSASRHGLHNDEGPGSIGVVRFYSSAQHISITSSIVVWGTASELYRVMYTIAHSFTHSSYHYDHWIRSSAIVTCSAVAAAAAFDYSSSSNMCLCNKMVHTIERVTSRWWAGNLQYVSML